MSALEEVEKETTKRRGGRKEARGKKRTRNMTQSETSPLVRAALLGIGRTSCIRSKNTTCGRYRNCIPAAIGSVTRRSMYRKHTNPSSTLMCMWKCDPCVFHRRTGEIYVQRSLKSRVLNCIFLHPQNRFSRNIWVWLKILIPDRPSTRHNLSHIAWKKYLLPVWLVMVVNWTRTRNASVINGRSIAP